MAPQFIDPNLRVSITLIILSFTLPPPGNQSSYVKRHVCLLTQILWCHLRTFLQYTQANSITTTTQHGCAQGFADDDFAVENYENYPSTFYSLQNKNLFPRSKFPMLRERDTPASHQAYALLRPVLLTCRIILQCYVAYASRVRRGIST